MYPIEETVFLYCKYNKTNINITSGINLYIYRVLKSDPLSPSPLGLEN